MAARCWPAVAWRAWPSEHVDEQLKGLPTKPGRLPLPRRARRGALRRQGEVAAPARALSTSRRAARDRPAISTAAATASHDVEMIVTEHRGRGAAPRAEPRQAPPAAVQRAAARRQVVPVHRGHRRGRLPARDVHARAPPARRRLLRAVREREEGARDARRAEPRLPLPALRGAEAGPPLGHSLPRLPHRPLPRAVRRLHLAADYARDHRRRVEFLSGDDRPIKRELERQMREAADEERFEDAARYRNRLSRPASRRAAGGRAPRRSARSTSSARARWRPRRRADLPAPRRR